MARPRVSCLESYCGVVCAVDFGVIGGARFSVFPYNVARFDVITALLMLICGSLFPAWDFLVSCCLGSSFGSRTWSWLLFVPALLVTFLAVVCICLKWCRLCCRSPLRCFCGHGLAMLSHRLRRLLSINGRYRSSALLFAQAAGLWTTLVVSVLPACLPCC